METLETSFMEIDMTLINKNKKGQNRHGAKESHDEEKNPMNAGMVAK